MLEIKSKLNAVWKTIFGRDIGGNEDFFDLGGDSLMGMQLIGEALKRGMEFNIADLYEYATIDELAEFILNENALSAAQAA